MNVLRSLVVASIFVAQAASAQDCSSIVQRLGGIDFSKASEIRASTSATFSELYAECDAKNSFAGKPLPTFQGKPLTCSSDPNRVKRLVQFPDKTVVFEAKASVDADGSPVSCGPNKSKTDQCQTWLTFDSGSSRKYVDAEQVPFVVIPLDVPSSNISFMKTTGIGKGDLAVAIYKDRCAFGVVGDAGPYFRLGELSIAAHAALNNPQCAGSEQPCQRLIGGGSGRGIASGVTYIVFPGTRPRPLTAESILEKSRQGAQASLDRFLEAYATPKQ